MRWHIEFCGTLLGLLASATLGKGIAQTNVALTPAQELTSFRLADPQLRVELVAAEPDVSSPVAMTWDAAGRLLVAEMRDYPNATVGGTIRLLEDRDRDGKYETATVFADQLPFPSSILPWRGGVLVTAAPDIWYLRDADGDGKAEERHRLFTGFGTGNQQLRVNGLFWGLDGWLYGANGRSDGQVRAVERWEQGRWVAAEPGPGVSIRGRDFRFRPDTGEFETLAGRSQFGHSRDDWGNRFLSWNTIPLRHEVFPDAFLLANPALKVADVLQDPMPPWDRGEVYPLTPPPLVFNNESGSHFNALSGLHLFGGDALGSSYRGNAFVGESLRNLVHRRVLVPIGPTFLANRGESNREFLASTDPWFHPVNFATGPDGALYVADFYRRFVEHPDWVAKEMRTQVPWAEGSERGRIWRIRRAGMERRGPVRRLDLLSPASLVEVLQQTNAWSRDTAQRLLLEYADSSVSGELRRLVRTAPLPESRLQAFTTLVSLGWVDVDTLRQAARDTDPHVRVAAVALAGARLRTTTSANASSGTATSSGSKLALTALVGTGARDPDLRVRLQAALALGGVIDSAEREKALGALVAATTNRWVRLAAASSSTSTQASWWIAVNQPPAPMRPAPAPVNPDPQRRQVVERFQSAVGMTGDPARGAVTVGRLCLACHYLQGRGQRVGPDLSGTSTRPPETLLQDILDPNRQVAPDYVACEVLLNDGTTVTGLLASETPTRITLRHPGAPDESLPRSQVREVRSTGRSLMPEGLEEGLSVQDLADLLAFLRAPNGELIPR